MLIDRFALRLGAEVGRCLRSMSTYIVFVLILILRVKILAVVETARIVVRALEVNTTVFVGVQCSWGIFVATVIVVYDSHRCCLHERAIGTRTTSLPTALTPAVMSPQHAC